MKKGFTLIEVLVVIAIVGIIASIMLVAFSGGRTKARDSARKAEISSFGRFLTLGCYTPDAGIGDYDLAQVVAELRIKYPQYAQQLSRAPRDPKGGTEIETRYRYIIEANGKCALYANFEAEEAASLTAISAPTAGGGTGIFHAATAGWNGSNTYFQYSN